MVLLLLEDSRGSAPPLKEKNPNVGVYDLECCDVMFMAGGEESCRESTIENAVIGHDEVEGPFTEIDGLPLADLVPWQRTWPVVRCPTLPNS